MKALGYIRVSTAEQATSALSLDHQREKIAAFALATDLELVEIVEDAGKSAKDLNRPGLKRVLAAVRSGTVGAVVILKLDRLTRSVRDLGELIDIFEERKVALIAVQDSINTQTAAGRMIVNILVTIAQWEREVIVERTLDALAQKRKRGEKTGGSIPYGFDSLPGGKLERNDREQSAIRLMARLRDSGKSLREIGGELLAHGFLPKAGKPSWSPQVVADILRRKR